MLIYNKGGTEKTVIMGVREALIQRFDAPDWLDLRIGFLLSITDKTGDDTITGLAETITAAPSLNTWDRFYVGVIYRPTFGTFIGYTNRGIQRGLTLGDSVLASSDAAIGTTNANFWLPHNARSGRVQNFDAQVIEGTEDANSTRWHGNGSSQIHFAQDATGAGGYATEIMLRLRRDNIHGRRNTITTTLKSGVHSGDVLFTDDPSKVLLQAEMEGYPGTVQSTGPIELTNVPDSLFLYSPFHNSRLRIHCMGIEKIAQ